MLAAQTIHAYHVTNGEMQEHFKGYVYFDNPNFDKNAINAVDAVRITMAKNTFLS